MQMQVAAARAAMTVNRVAVNVLVDCNWRRRAKAAVVLGCHWSLESSAARRSCVQLSSCADCELFLAIFFDVLLAKGFLSTADERSDGCGIQVENRSDFLVREILTPQKQKLCLTRVDGGQGGANSFLLLAGGVDLLWCGRRTAGADPGEKAFVVRATSLATESVNPGADGDAVEPAFHIFVVSLLVAPKFQEHFDGKLFGARAIPHYSGDDSGHARVMSAKEQVDIELRRCSGDVGDGFAGCVHNGYNAARRESVTTQARGSQLRLRVPVHWADARGALFADDHGHEEFLEAVRFRNGHAVEKDAHLVIANDAHDGAGADDGLDGAIEI